jgi:hypothetical protein
VLEEKYVINVLNELINYVVGIYSLPDIFVESDIARVADK